MPAATPAAMQSASAGDASLPTATQWDLHELELLDDASSLPDNPFDVELFAVSSMDESNVALFHPHPTSSAWLSFLYATKDGRIRAFRFGRPER